MKPSELKSMLLLDVARRSTEYVAAQARQPVLAAYDSAQDLLAVLADPDTDRYPEKERLLRAVLADLRHAPKLWSAVLMVAFHPALNRLRRRVDGAPEDLDQIVHEAFLEALVLAAKDQPARTALHLRAKTTIAVRKELRRSRRERERIELADELEGNGTDVFLGAGGAPITRDDWAELRALLEQLAKPLVNRAALSLVFDTLVKGEHLRAQRSRKPFDDVDRLYQRLKRQRTRAVQKLETVRQALHDRIADRAARFPLDREPWEDGDE